MLQHDGLVHCRWDIFSQGWGIPPDPCTGCTLRRVSHWMVFLKNSTAMQAILTLKSPRKWDHLINNLTNETFRYCTQNLRMKLHPLLWVVFHFAIPLYPISFHFFFFFSEDSDQEGTDLLQSTGNYLDTPEFLPKGTIQMKACADANQDSHAERKVVHKIISRPPPEMWPLNIRLSFNLVHSFSKGQKLHLIPQKDRYCNSLVHLLFSFSLSKGQVESSWVSSNGTGYPHSWHEPDTESLPGKLSPQVDKVEACHRSPSNKTTLRNGTTTFSPK